MTFSSAFFCRSAQGSRQGSLQSALHRGSDRLYIGLCEGRIRQGIEEALHVLQRAPTREVGSDAVVAVTGDYYTRVVPFANNDVYQEIESLGGVLWSPPTFSDSFKMGTLRN